MAFSSRDPVTGAPRFADTDAPDLAVNPTQVAEFAAMVGTRLIGPTTARTAYEWARRGLEWFDTTDGCTYRHDGTSWKLWTVPPRSFTPSIRSGIVLGNGTLTGSWWMSDGKVTASIVFVAGSTTTHNGIITFYLPHPVSPVAGVVYSNVCTVLDVSAGDRFSGNVFVLDGYASPRTFRSGSSEANVRVVFVRGDGGTPVPMVWAVGDSMTLEFTYPAA